MEKTQLKKLLQCAEKLCANRGVRFTEKRRAVFELVCSSSKPMSAYEILERMPKAPRAATPPTVYRALDFLVEQGLVHKLESIHAFVGCNRPQNPHSGHFLICTDCGTSTEVENSLINQSLKSTEKETGFHINKKVIEFLGVCQECTHQSSQ